MKYLAIIFFALVLYSCHNRNLAEQGKADMKDTGTARVSLVDTLRYKDKPIYAEPIDSNEFLKIASDAIILDSNEVIDDTANVHRSDSTLILRLGNGDSIKLVSSPNSENIDSFIIYKYCKYIKNINCYLILDLANEVSIYTLWNKANGKKIFVIGAPVISPNGKMMICCNSDLMAHFNMNGFQIWGIHKDSINIIWEQETDSWGPKECKWKDNNILLFKADYLDTFNIRRKYTMLKLPNFTK